MGSDRLIDLDYQLHTCVDQFQEYLDEYWSEALEAEDWSQLNQLLRDADEIADALHRRALALQNIGDASTLNSIYAIHQLETKAARDQLERSMQDLAERLHTKLNPDDIRKLLDTVKRIPSQPADPEEASDRPMHLVWQCLCVKDGRQAAEGMRDRVRRMFQLDKMVTTLRRDFGIPEPTQQFLALMGRTFVWGFDAECVILCRGAIDTAFREKVPLELLHSRGRPDNHGEYGLGRRIEAAFPTLINEEQKFAAERVKCRGDVAIHGSPHATKDIVGTVRDALIVVDTLAQLPDAQNS